MPPARVPGPAAPNLREMVPDPEIKADVDWMILDYLVSIAIMKTLSVDNFSREPEDPKDVEEVDWLVDAVGAFRSTTQSETSLPLDLDIKLRVLRVAHRTRHYMPTLEQHSREHCSLLSEIGIEFMDLCAAAVHKVSETRWFDTGARFMVQAVLEEQLEGNPPSDILSKLCAWAPNDPARNSKWMRIRQSYTKDLPNHDNISAARVDLNRKFPFEEFRSFVLVFLFDLMTTLDSPLLIQLERGQVGNLTRDETQRLKERVGLR